MRCGENVQTATNFGDCSVPVSEANICTQKSASHCQRVSQPRKRLALKLIRRPLTYHMLWSDFEKSCLNHRVGLSRDRLRKRTWSNPERLVLAQPVGSTPMILLLNSFFLNFYFIGARSDEKG